MFGKKGFTAAASVAIAMVISSVAEAVVHKPGYTVPMPIVPIEIRAFWEVIIVFMFGI